MKNNKQTFFIIIILLLFQNLQAQKTIKEEDRKIIVKMIYGMDSEILKSGDLKFKSVIYKPEDFFSKPFSLEEADTCYKLMNETAKIEFKKDRIYFITNILNSLNNNDLRGSLIEIHKSENKLFYGKDSLEINNGQGRGNRIENDIYQITVNYPLETEIEDLKKVHGSFVMKVDFLIGYNSANLTKNDIGKNVLIGKDTISIVNIIENSIILKGSTEKVNIINFVSNERVSKPLTIDDKGYDMEKSFSLYSVSIYKSDYENIGLKHLTYEEYDKLMTLEKLKERQNEEQYKIIKNVAKIGEKFILYKPYYKTYYLTIDYKPIE